MSKKQKLSVEIVEFNLPGVNKKNLFITGIPFMPEDELVDILYSTFTKYGLIYGTQTYPYSTANFRSSDVGPSGFYAFVTFYLAMSARQAKDHLKGKIVIRDVECKINYGKKKKESTGVQPLHFSKCQELANYFLGFNGWSTSLKHMDGDISSVEQNTYNVKQVCVMRLDIRSEGLYTEGMGAWEEHYTTLDPTSRAKATCKSKKLAYQRAVENAFSKVILIVLSNGKVSVEVDTTRPELLLTEKVIDDDNLLKVNELDFDPMEFDDDDDDDDTLTETKVTDIDAANLHILHELEDV